MVKSRSQYIGGFKVEGEAKQGASVVESRLRSIGVEPSRDSIGIGAEVRISAQ
jgi:hypothetical protein